MHTTQRVRATLALSVFFLTACLVACGGGSGSGASGGTATITASSTTTAQSLTVGTAMASFSPLAPSGGTAPYSYSYTGTLPSGLAFNTSTGTVTGTPTAIFSTAPLVFSVRDANGVVASTTSTVSFSVATSSAYVAQGGLSWMPVTFGDTWTNANAYCANTTINGQTGWRLPTSAELSALYSSGAMNSHGWTLGFTWSADQDGPFGGVHWLVDLSSGTVNGYVDTQIFGVTCVR